MTNLINNEEIEVELIKLQFLFCVVILGWSVVHCIDYKFSYRYLTLSTHCWKLVDLRSGYILNCSRTAHIALTSRPLPNYVSWHCLLLTLHPYTTPCPRLGPHLGRQRWWCDAGARRAWGLLFGRRGSA